jgi:Plasmid pRiA4b ORF-3-like protein
MESTKMSGARRFLLFSTCNLVDDQNMVNRPADQVNTYFIRVALRGISPMIWRRLRVRGNMSLADLHHIIQIAMGWDNEYLHCFHVYGEDYGIAYEGGMSFSHNARQVFVDDFDFDAGDRFTYTYNFTKH